MAGVHLPGAERLVHRAKWVMRDPETVLENGYVDVAEGCIRDAGRGALPRDSRIRDHGEGVLMPALVNAHTHLELSGLKGRVKAEGGFLPWVTELVRQRDAMDGAALIAATADAVDRFADTGAAVVGEVSTHGRSRAALMRSSLRGIYFQEVLGIPETLPQIAPDGNPLRVSIAGHAPHTTAPEILRRAKAATRQAGAVFSIHLDESEEETRFLTTGTGAWADFLIMRGIDFTTWGIPAQRPVPYADALGLLDPLTLAVHVLGSDRDELAFLARRRVKVCVCPRSNHRLYGRLPDIAGMLEAGLNPCLGTDSLASVDSLSLLDEMAFVARHFPDLPPSLILTLATRNGAAALGMGESCGSLDPGKWGALLFVPLSEKKTDRLLERIVHENPFHSV